ncbi:MAG: exodeoxyribonuclease V subunit alpha [Alphaproteobacteria bacterium]|nr:exodeoxyribonuclease V subunit alpha [Alphaproteobacteria bacterium]
MSVLDRLAAAGGLEPLDLHLGRVLLRQGADERVALAAALASRAVGEGDTCVDLAQRVATPLRDGEGQVVEGWTWPSLDAWISCLAASPWVTSRRADEPTVPPLVLRGHQVALARYAAHERRLAEGLTRLATAGVPPLDATLLDASVARLFTGFENAAQQQAVRAAAGQALTVLAGGPGTGKTTTVVRLLAALLEQAAGAGRPLPRIRLLAPTGKAAARLAESMAAQVEGLSLDPAHGARVRAALPVRASTIHRALGRRNAWGTRVAHDAGRPWSDDVVVVDEASMVDLPLMARLVDALRPGARLVLLGDPDQLAAVGAGAVLADLCAPGLEGPVAEGVVHLVGSRRFAEAGGVGQLARALHAGDGPAATALLGAGGALRSVVPAGPPARDPAVIEELALGYRALATAADPAARLAALGAFRVLCAVRRGPAGVEALNRAVEAALRRRGWLEAPSGRPDEEGLVAGRPILVTANDYDVDLFNGDLGVLDRDAQGQMRAWFATPSGVRAVLPARLPPHEPCFAMTVHKAQGSEVEHVTLVLPDADHVLVTRELVYTAITRARAQVTVVGRPELLRAGLDRRAVRTTGLRGALAEAAEARAPR